MIESVQADLTMAEEAAKEAGLLLREAVGGNHEVHYKSADQPVTQADLQADRILRSRLLDPRPGYGWLSEESPGREDESGVRWVVDPLDGTRNFIDGRSGFAVCIGLQSRGTTVAGVVYDPMSGALYSASLGHGARLNGVPIRAREARETPTIIVSAAELSRGSLGPVDQIGKVETLGSTALKMAKVAEGKADLYLSKTPKGLWDVAAAGLIAREAGARFLELDGREVPDHEAPSNGMVVVGPVEESRISGWLKQLGNHSV